MVINFFTVFDFFFLQILYIFFVALFTYFLLVDYQFYEITTIEIVCIVWIFTFIVDELYTVSLHTFPATYSHWKVLAVKVVFKLVVENTFSMVKQNAWVLSTWMHDLSLFSFEFFTTMVYKKNFSFSST